jgi:CheY-like chemotaxis protein
MSPIGRVLVVDDEELLRQYASAHLKRLGYDAVCVASGAQALTLLERDAAFTVLLTDVVMPGMSGIELVRRVRDLGLDIPAIYMSGYAKDVFDHEGGPEAGRLLTKPYRAGQLAEMLAIVASEEVAPTAGA